MILSCGLPNAIRSVLFFNEMVDVHLLPVWWGSYEHTNLVVNPIHCGEADEFCRQRITLDVQHFAYVIEMPIRGMNIVAL